jgi:hypothetical protein
MYLELYAAAVDAQNDASKLKKFNYFISIQTGTDYN